MKRGLVIILLVLAGCRAQPYNEIQVWTSTNGPVAVGPGISGGVTLPVERISILCENARVEDLVRKIIEHQGLTPEFHVDLSGHRCNNSLTHVPPLAALESILEVNDCVFTQDGQRIIIRAKETNPEPEN